MPPDNKATVPTTLHLIICRQGNAEPVAGLAHAIQQAFRGNGSGDDFYLATMSDLPAPIRSFSRCPSDLDPVKLLNGALHTLVVVLVDDDFAADKAWSGWMKAVERHIADSGGRHHLVALCANKAVKKAYKQIKGRKAGRHSEKIGYDDTQGQEKGYAFGEPAERPAWIALYVLQSCRHLLARHSVGVAADNDKRKLRLFISHAKKDSLPLANSIRFALKQKQYFSAWYDAEDLAGVEDWRAEIRNGVDSSAVVVLRTQAYDTRPWCRQEFIWADQCAVPLVCVEARSALELAADTLSGSRVPTVRIPDGNLFRILFLALKESLRILQLQQLMLQLRQTHVGMKQAKARFLIPYTPTLQHLTFAAKVISENRKQSRSGFNVILYADPPLDAELYQASKTYIQDRCGMTYMLTPTLLPFWRVTADAARSKPRRLPTHSLRKKRINISISEHEADMHRLGFNPNEVNGFTVQIAQALIANEAIVAFGHDWRDDGVMQAIYRFGEEHQNVVLHEHERPGLIENYCFWGMEPGLSERERGHLRGILDIIECDRPGDARLSNIDRLGQVPGNLRGYAFARALTVMRRQMTDKVTARVCLGGRDMDRKHPEKGPSGRCPGVVEEALMSCLADQPLFLSGLIGGVTQQVINALENKAASFAFKLPEVVAKGYSGDNSGKSPNVEKGLSRARQKHLYHYDGPLSTSEIITVLGHYGSERVANNNGLSVTENRCLYEAATIDEVIHWVLTGLARLRDR